MGFFEKLKQGLKKTRDSFAGAISGIAASFTKIDEELFEEIEETLIMADVGVDTALKVVENLRAAIKRDRVTDPAQVKSYLKDALYEILAGDTALQLPTKPTILLVIGVNGVGKTTTIGKIAADLRGKGNKVLLAAADTFRAAAIDQLQVWGQRAGCDVIAHQEGSDPAAVVFDAVQAAKARGADVLICDTAGRLHNKKNLMAELEKIGRVIDREAAGCKKETFLVLDATTGQNGVNQAKQFMEVTDLTGIVLTKLDGTAKGGVVVAIKDQLGLPVRYIGVGEQVDDLQPFDAREFIEALFSEEQ
ncbi:signal recognition particle-docking protein FtsY [Neobittarella massiliensis]|uniref:Signal recognition particle receptor FtsY n=2 Tax=Oscillospiraceae TaxID=216572 RepID=A0A8J6LTG2_9FIRM|nr:signal recognition particle-docking protein FtsY [Neobittarella massiliensis]MBC3515329.1 signal recognition particle-docking protein FtsY [Neobittarella massiliensis]SCJ59804.1 Cell division protein FtsY homolog [uncultured Anaerotruncus sp.]